jgi:anti-sigma factor RsiW
VSLFTRDLACQQMVEIVTDYLEGAMSRPQRRRFERHLAGCEHCSEYLAQMRITIELTGRLRGEDLSPNTRRDLAAVFRRWIAEEPGPA